MEVYNIDYDTLKQDKQNELYIPVFIGVGRSTLDLNR